MSKPVAMTNVAHAARLKSLIFACCLVVCAASLSGSVYAQRNGELQNGRIEVSTTPGGYPLIVDGQQRGTTSPTVQLYELPPGRHTVEIQFPNNTRWVRAFDIAANKKQCITLNYRPKTISIERPVIAKSPCPYPVNISAPASVQEGKIITFSADVDYAGQSGLIYTWTISPPGARILSGAGEPTITVDTTGVKEPRVTAILVVDDGSGDRTCRQRAQAVTGITQREDESKPEVFTTLYSTSFNEDKANFDNFVTALQKEPKSVGYIIVYGGRRGRRGDRRTPQVRATDLGKRTLGYLVNTRNMDSSRFVVKNGGTRDWDYIELWVLPVGAPPPQPSPR